MQLQVRGRNIELTEALRAHVERRLQFALSRFGQRIGRVLVRLADVNGPRGGDDKSCHVDVNLFPSGSSISTSSGSHAEAGMRGTNQRSPPRATLVAR